MSTKLEAAAAIQFLKSFVNKSQLWVLADNTRGEEGQFFIDKLCEMADRISAMPETYGQDGRGDQAIAYLHYFVGGCDWYITERDVDSDGEGQVQAFGQADLGYELELGYISITELLENNVEIDLYFAPATLAEVNRKKGA